MNDAQTRPGERGSALGAPPQDASVGVAGVPTPPAWRHRLRALRALRLSKRQIWWSLGFIAAAAFIVIVIGTPIADGDTASDLWRSLDATAQNLGQMPWQIAPALLVVSLLHYVAAAIALRAASGRPLPLRESV